MSKLLILNGSNIYYCLNTFRVMVLSSFKHLESTIWVLLLFEYETHVDHSLRVDLVTLNRLLTILEASIKILNLISLHSKTIVSQSNVTVVVSTVIWLQLCCSFIMLDALLKVFHDKSHSCNEFMKNRITLDIFHSNT